MKEEGVRGGRSRWSLLMAAKAQVNVEPVFAGYKRRPRVPSQGPFLWALLLLLLVFVLLLHPPPSSEPGWAWRWHRGPFVVHPRTRALCLSYSLFSSPLCLSLFFFLSLSTHTTPPPPPPPPHHHPPFFSFKGLQSSQI